MLELVARGAMRIAEVLKIVPNDVSERKILLRDPKSGREFEMIFIPQKVADRLRDISKIRKSDYKSAYSQFVMRLRDRWLRKLASWSVSICAPMILEDMPQH